jgi:hypothetical protein
VEYGLVRHFPGLKRYVLDGGGLIVVGGSESFGRGGYAESPLAEVLPVELPAVKSSASEVPFVPEYTLIGRRAPMLAPLRKLHGDRLPEMGGTNLVGSARRSALVLWEHPTLGAVQGAGRMPILALGEFGDGRTIALTVDATHKLKFGPLAAASSGRGHSALWEGLLGWLMRDSRYEAAEVVPDAPCAAGRPLTLRGSLLASGEATLRLQIRELSPGGSQGPAKVWSAPGALDRPARFEVGSLSRGGYVARVDADGAPPSRLVFPCEVAAGAFRDSRPDTSHLKRLVEPYGGDVFSADEVAKVPEPPEALVVTKSRSRPLLPPWVWSSLAAACLGLHFWFRRSEGLL